jgi:hypothetical protein
LILTIYGLIPRCIELYPLKDVPVFSGHLQARFLRISPSYSGTSIVTGEAFMIIVFDPTALENISGVVMYRD